MNLRTACAVALALLAGCGTSTESKIRNLVCIGFCAQQDGERTQTIPEAK